MTTKGIDPQRFKKPHPQLNPPLPLLHYPKHPRIIISPLLDSGRLSVYSNSLHPQCAIIIKANCPARNSGESLDRPSMRRRSCVRREEQPAPVGARAVRGALGEVLPKFMRAAPDAQEPGAPTTDPPLEAEVQQHDPPQAKVSALIDAPEVDVSTRALRAVEQERTLMRMRAAAMRGKVGSHSRHAVTERLITEAKGVKGGLWSLSPRDKLLEQANELGWAVFLDSAIALVTPPSSGPSVAPSAMQDIALLTAAKHGCRSSSSECGEGEQNCFPSASSEVLFEYGCGRAASARKHQRHEALSPVQALAVTTGCSTGGRLIRCRVKSDPWPLRKGIAASRVSKPDAEKEQRTGLSQSPKYHSGKVEASGRREEKGCIQQEQRQTNQQEVREIQEAIMENQKPSVTVYSDLLSVDYCSSLEWCTGAVGKVTLKRRSSSQPKHNRIAVSCAGECPPHQRSIISRVTLITNTAWEQRVHFIFLMTEPPCLLSQPLPGRAQADPGRTKSSLRWSGATPHVPSSGPRAFAPIRPRGVSHKYLSGRYKQNGHNPARN
ncbi:hypothetical protein DNTS_009118 [Danionella cerebrum]|uniref:Uncharacterized protein n=1 Tax=Danionella cerebrum TaxID=2873325 RepID=A0A553QAQ7_9TELE|nr:hypothetical protein DNTS_009118 [Danionella translucida]